MKEIEAIFKRAEQKKETYFGKQNTSNPKAFIYADGYADGAIEQRRIEKAKQCKVEDVVVCIMNLIRTGKVSSLTPNMEVIKMVKKSIVK